MTDLVDVGRLVAYATDVTKIPGSTGETGEYRRLVQRYIIEPEFRNAVDDVLEGADCEVAEVSETVGLVLYPRPGSLWAWPAKSSELSWNRGTDSGERAARMLTVVALLARQFPTGIDIEAVLDDPDRGVHPVSVQELEQYIRDFCEQQRDGQPDVASDLSDDQVPLWSWWLGRDAYADTDRRTSRGTTSYVVYTTLDTLRELGLLIDLTANKPAEHKRYRMKRRLLVQYRDFLMNPLFVALREANHRPDPEA